MLRESLTSGSPGDGGMPDGTNPVHKDLLRIRGFQVYTMQGMSLADLVPHIEQGFLDANPEAAGLRSTPGSHIAVPIRVTDERRSFLYHQHPDEDPKAYDWERLIEDLLWNSGMDVPDVREPSIRPYHYGDPVGMDIPTAPEIGEIELGFRERNGRSVLDDLHRVMGPGSSLLTRSTPSGDGEDSRVITFSTEDGLMRYTAVPRADLDASIGIIPIVRAQPQ
ncbi:hypothetical protein HYW39_02550 [Candidatus Curtissbacteria bacterium]|nr:hypothetical protein [Candidatus Curtissbacteria bacterium]